jgi:hypothetical protein
MRLYGAELLATLAENLASGDDLVVARVFAGLCDRDGVVHVGGTVHRGWPVSRSAQGPEI